MKQIISFFHFWRLKKSFFKICVMSPAADISYRGLSEVKKGSESIQGVITGNSLHQLLQTGNHGDHCSPTTQQTALWWMLMVFPPSHV